MEKISKVYQYVDGINDLPFPNAKNQLEIKEFTYDAKRMGGAPTISASVKYPTCLDDEWTGKEYVDFRGEKYVIKQTPSSSYSNEDNRYKHDVAFVSERTILDNTYFYDVVTDPTDVDKYVSNSGKVIFFGDIHEFAKRLDYSLKYSKVGYTVVVDEGISTEEFMMSFEDQFFSQVLQSIFEVYKIPYYFVGKVIHIGYTDNVITRTFKYGVEDALLSISKTNANYKIVNRITGTGSTDNIPYYYPNPSDKRTEIEESGGKWITPSDKLMPPIYRGTLGEERFYNAKNKTYRDPETFEYYIFENEYVDGNPKEHKVSFDYIKPSINGMTNARGYRIDIFEEFAYDANDNDNVDDEGKYIHPYFFGKLRRFDGANGFNLFEHAIDKDEMTISMTSGSCGSCNFVIAVDEATQKNTVQVHKNGSLLRDKDGNVITSGTPQDQQNDTSISSVWVALKKDVQTFGVIMPNVSNNYKPNALTDTFVILHIDLPQTYITSAENKLKEEIIKYMATNNSDKFNFSINFSRIFFAENPDILALLNENARLQIEYNNKLYELYVSSYSYKMSNNDPLPQITVELSDTLTINKGTLQTSIDSVKQDIMSSIGGGDFLMHGLKYFVRKDVRDYAKFIVHRDGLDIGNFESLLSGGTFRKDTDGKSYIEVDRLYVRLKAIFENLEIKRTTYVGGEQIASPAAMKCVKVLDRNDIIDSETGDVIGQNVWDYYRCFYLKEQEGVKIQNEFRIGDQAICKEANIASGSNVSNQYYWRLVTGTGDGYIDLSKADCDTGSTIPSVGDDIVQLGNRTDVTRQKAIIQSTVSIDAPSIKLLAGINSFSLDGKAIISQGFDSLTGKATFNVYGNAYIGNPDGSSFIKYTPEKGVEINATLSIGTKFGNEGNSLLDALEKATQDAVKESSTKLNDYASLVTKDIDNLQNQIDGAVETWFEDPIPTLSNKPAINWNTIGLKNHHLGDIYYSGEGKIYRFQMEGSTYIWKEIIDTELTKALELAKKAQDTADGKRKVFVRQPLNTEDYAVGDLWANATFATIYKNDLLRCKTAKAANVAFNIVHWELASKYTDDTKALEAAAAAAAAQNTADAAKEASDVVAGNVSDLNYYVNGAFKDGLITESEAQAIATYINTINNNKHSADNQYSKLYSNVYLSGTAKTNLFSAKTDLDTATTNLLSSINEAIKDGKTTVGEKEDVDAKFELYNTGNATFSTRIEEANKAIQDKLKTYSDEASMAAAAAATLAGNAQTSANTANSAVSELNTYIDGAFKDGVISEAEAAAIEKYINSVNNTKSEVKATFDKLYANTFLTGSAKTDLNAKYNALNTSITNLLSSINTAITDGETTTEEKADVDAKFSLFNTAYAAFSTSIESANKAIQDNLKSYSDAALSAANKAQTDANDAKDEAAKVDGRVSELNTYIDGAFKDGVISEAEAAAIEKYINSVNESKKANDALYTKLYANPYLEGTAKTGLASSKTSLDTEITNLLKSINTAIEDGETTAVEKADVDAKYTLYSTALADFNTSIEAANTAIQTRLKTYSDAASQAASNAQSSANSAQTSANTANNLLSDIASDSKLTASEKQETKKEWDIIVSEKAKNDASADFYGVSKTAYGTAYSALNTYIAPLLASLTTTSNIVGTTFRSTFKTYYDARTDLLNAIAKKAKQLADAAQSSANQAIKDIAGFSYLSQALEQPPTEIKNGLILSSLVSLGYKPSTTTTFKVMSGINGIYDDTKPGNGISYWAGGDMKDLAEDYPLPWKPNNPPKPADPSKYAKSVVRMDGTVYFAGGNMWIDIDGKIHCDPLSFFVGEEQVGDILTLFTPVTTGAGSAKKVVGARQNHPFEDGTGKGRLMIGKHILSEDSNGYLSLTKNDGTPANFYTSGGLSSLGLSPDIGGGSGGGVYSIFLGDVEYPSSDGIVKLPPYPVVTSLTWANITNKPSWIGSSKPTYSWTEIGSKPTTFTPSAHTQGIGTISDVNATWQTMVKIAPAAYNTRWASWAEVTSKPTWIGASKPSYTYTEVGAEKAFAKNTAFNKNFGADAGTVAQGNDSRILNGQTAFSWGNHSGAGYAKSALIGAASGIAPLDENKLIPSSYLPSYVDDVLEYTSFTTLPTKGESGKIYVTTDTNITYRWSGTAYVEISKSLALGETASTAYAGSKGKANATAITALKAITITAGTGLTGGGNLTANRTLSLSSSGVTDGTYTKLTVDIYGRVTKGTTLSESDIPALSISKTTGLQAALDAKALKTTSIIAGLGLTGGGTLAGSRTINIASANDGITINADNIQLNAINNLTSTSTTKPLSAAQGKALSDKLSDMFEKVNVGTTTAPIYAIKAKYGLYTDQFLSALGLAPDLGVGGGTGVYTVYIGNTAYNSSNGIVKLPSYPTTLPASDVYDWAKASTKPSYTKSEVGLGSVNNTADSAKNVLSATKLTTARTINGVSFNGTANITITAAPNAHNQAWSTITGTPTTIAGYGITNAVLNTDARLTDARNAKDVYAWAKASVKPSYTYSEVGAMRNLGRVVADANHADFRVSGSYGLKGTVTNIPSGMEYTSLIVSHNIDVGLQLLGGYNNNKLFFRGWSNSGTNYYSWHELIHTGNYRTKLDNTYLYRIRNTAWEPNMMGVNPTVVETTSAANRPSSHPWHQYMNWGTDDINYGFQFANDYTVNANLYFRYKVGGNWYSWKAVLDSENYPSVIDARYVKKSGDTMTGPLTINSSINNNYNEGIRITRAANKFAGITLGTTGTSGIPVNGWFIATIPDNSFIINENSIPSGGLQLIKNGNALWRNNIIWHSGNDGSGSGLDADLLDGLHLHTGRNNEANKVVRTDGNGYIQAGYINISNGHEKNASSPTYVWGANATDGYIRSYQTSYLKVAYSADSDKLNGYHRDNLYSSIKQAYKAWGTNSGITVTGDANTYYPVVISIDAQKNWNSRISIYKNLGSTTPSSYPGNHVGGTSSMWFMYEGRSMAWDGNNGYIVTKLRDQSYATLVSHAYWTGNSGGNLVIYLRGGGCFYEITCDYNATIRVFYSKTEIDGSTQYPTYVEPRTTIGNKGLILGKKYDYQVYSATKLATSSTINGTSFDGTANIVTSYWGTARTLSAGTDCIGSVSVNGSGNVTLPITVNTATKLRTARSIWGQSFNGTGNVNGTIHIKTNTGNYTEGIRLYGIAKNAEWSNIQFGCDPAASSGTHENQWLLGRSGTHDFVLSRGSSNGENGFVVTTNSYMGVGIVSPSYKLHVSGDILANNWSRARLGFLIESTSLHVCSNNGYLELDSSGSELMISGGAEINVNYRPTIRGTVPTTWKWRSGSSTSWAKMQMGITTINGTLTATSTIVAPTFSGALSGNASSATKLATSRTLWGQSFNGTANVSGALTGVSSITASGSIVTSARSTFTGGIRALIGSTHDWSTAAVFAASTYPLVLYSPGGTANTRTYYFRINANRMELNTANDATALVKQIASFGHNGTATWYNTNTFNTKIIASNGIRAGYTNDTYRISTDSFVCNSWVRTNGEAGWYSQTYGGGIYQTDSNQVRVYNNKVLYNDGYRVWGIGGHHCGLKLYQTSNIGINLANDKFTWGIYSNNNGNMYIGRRTGNVNDSTGSYYLTIGSTTMHYTGSFVATSSISANNATINDRISIFSDGKIVPYSTGTRRSGMYGVYDSTKIGHIWSIGAAYMIPDNGDNFGSLYGLAYKHVNNATGGSMAGGHQAVWCINGVPKVAFGENIWTAGNIVANGGITALSSASDIRLKEQLTTYNALPVINSLRSVAYKWNDKAKNYADVFKTDAIQFGLIAQELQIMFPMFVKNMFDEYLTIDYERLIPICWRGIQELSDISNKHESRLDKLERENKELKEENFIIKKELLSLQEQINKN